MSEDTQGKVLFCSGVKGDTRRYRSFHPYEQLRMVSIPVEICHITDPGLMKKIDQAETIVLHRAAMDKEVERAFNAIESRGKLALVDVDDLVFDRTAFQWIDSPDFADPVRAALYRAGMQSHRQTLERAAGVIASTEFLAKKAQEIKPGAAIHRNAFSTEMLARSQLAYEEKPVHPGRVVIGYASGTRTHDRDFALVKPVLMHILKQYPQTELWLIGPLDPGKNWAGVEERVKKLTAVPWQSLPILLTQFDINLAPLVLDNPFAQSKSEIKFMEAALVHVPTVASPTEAFRFAIQPSMTGFLAETEEEWLGSLERLVADADLRKQVGDAAYTNVVANYHPFERGFSLTSILNTFRERSGLPEIALPENEEPISRNPLDWQHLWVGWDIEDHPTLIEMGLYSIRVHGVGYLFKQVWVFLRRLFAPVFPFKKGDN